MIIQMFCETPCRTLVLGAAVGAYFAGSHLDHVKVPAQQIAGIGITAGSTIANAGGIVRDINTVTFAATEPAPPVIPASDRFQQG